jgi:hypothetical protein
MLHRFENVLGKQAENERLCRSRLDLILITAINMEKRRFEQFYPVASVSRWGQIRPLVLTWRPLDLEDQLQGGKENSHRTD